MATPGQRDAYRRVIHLIMEEVEGCQLDPRAMETVELMNVVRELEARIIEGPTAPKAPSVTPHTPAKSTDRKYAPRPKKGKVWQHGPLAKAASGAVAKPPWFSED